MNKLKIQTTAKLYEMHSAAKRLLGSEFHENIRKYKLFITACMAKHNIDSEIKAAMHLVEEVPDDDRMAKGVFTMKIFAAVVEMIEPST